MASEGPGARRLGHRPALDGLRGVAALAVVAFHYGLLRGGWMGVDVFFALSGFLITTLLLQERREHGRIDVGQFYVRRARRLVPALVLFIVFVVTVAVLIGNERTVFRGAPGVLAYATNWMRAFDVDGTRVVGHTWSLAVEEQFYLVWPVVLIVLGRARRVLPACLLGAVVVVLWRLHLVDVGADLARISNGSDTHADGLLYGCAAAAALQLGRTAWTRWAPLALAGLAVAFVVLPRELPPLALSVFAPVGAASASVVAHVVVSPDGWIARTLRGRVWVFLGEISYALYLFHFPVELWTRQWSTPGRVAALVGVFAAATASTRLWEAQWRSSRHRLARQRPRGPVRRLATALLASD